MKNYFSFQNADKCRFLEFDGKISLKSNNKNNQLVYDKIMSVFNTNKNGTLDANEILFLYQNFIEADKDFNEIITLEEIEAYTKKDKLFKKLNINPRNLMWFMNVLTNTIINSFKKTRPVVERRLIENYKKKYPANKYLTKIEKFDEVNYTTITITEKNSKKVVETCDIAESGHYTKKFLNNPNSYHYDKNGKLVKYVKYDGNRDPILINPISEAIYKDITAKNGILPTTGKDIEKHIKQITPLNVVEILENYNENCGETLLDAINGEWGLNKSVKQRLIQHLNDCLKKSVFWQGYKGNTKIDEFMNQTTNGDCWFLGTIAAIACNPKGLEILNKTIKETSDGDYIVKFKGCNKSYKVTPIEIFSMGYSMGSWNERDLITLEVAAKKHYNILGIDGGTTAEAMDLLLGTKDKWKNYARVFRSTHDNEEELKRLIKDPNTIVTTSTSPKTKVNKDKEYAEDIISRHAYAVIDIDDSYVYLKNPWHADELTEIRDKRTIKIPINEFLNIFENVQYVTLN